MSPTTMTKAPSAPKHAPRPALDVPDAESETVFTPSAELGEQFDRMEQAQAEIDRKQAEELSRLREIQDRD